jgi:hypothetical protein
MSTAARRGVIKLLLFGFAVFVVSAAPGNRAAAQNYPWCAYSGAGRTVDLSRSSSASGPLVGEAGYACAILNTFLVPPEISIHGVASENQATRPGSCFATRCQKAATFAARHGS